MGKAMFAAVGIILAELYTGKVGYGFVVYRGSFWYRVDHSRPSYLALPSILLYPFCEVVVCSFMSSWIGSVKSLRRGRMELTRLALTLPPFEPSNLGI